MIARAGRPVARLVALAPERKRRVLGQMDGKFRLPDNFNDPFPDDLLDLFEGA